MHLNLSHRPRRSRKYNLNWPQEPAYVGDDSFSGISCVVPGTPLTSSCLSQHVVVHATAVVVAHHLPRHLRLCGSLWRLSTSSPQPPAGLLYPLKQRINRQRSYIQRIYWFLSYYTISLRGGALNRCFATVRNSESTSLSVLQLHHNNNG